VEHASSLLALATTVATPYTQYLSDLAAAKRDWWIGIVDDYLNWVSDVNAQHNSKRREYGPQHLPNARQRPVPEPIVGTRCGGRR
jgi:hypothetical protein